MKRYGFLYPQICAYENIELAHKSASKGKSHYRDVIMVNQDPIKYLTQIHDILCNKQFVSSKYVEQIVIDRTKERTIHKLPYYPDRIVHHAIMQIVYPILTKCLIRNTFQSIQGRGVIDCRERIRDYLSNNSPTYYVKVDIKKFYPSVDKEILKIKLETKIKCQDTLNILAEIIDASPSGLPIGNYTSQILGNFYLSQLDWKLCHSQTGYFRYCDDILIFTQSVKKVVDLITVELRLLNLSARYMKSGQFSHVLFVGYSHRKDMCRLSKQTVNRIYKVAKRNKPLSMSSYKGLVLHIDNFNLLSTIKESIERTL